MKVIAIDFDGTLYHPDIIDFRIHEAIKKKGLLESLSRINKNISETKDKIYSRATYFERVE